jgi:uncharacterized LabA/DUF88 family protein
MKKIVLMIDGGFLRVAARNAGKIYDPAFIESFSKACPVADEELFRVLYYDCAPYQGQQKLPVSGLIQTFAGSDQWLLDLAKKDLIAVRRGVLKFRGYKLKRVPVAGIAALSDADFKLDFEQKGVDMRIGLDIACYSALTCVDRIGLVTADSGQSHECNSESAVRFAAPIRGSEGGLAYNPRVPSAPPRRASAADSTLGYSRGSLREQTRQFLTSNCERSGRVCRQFNSSKLP